MPRSAPARLPRPLRLLALAAAGDTFAAVKAGGIENIADDPIVPSTMIEPGTTVNGATSKYVHASAVDFSYLRCTVAYDVCRQISGAPVRQLGSGVLILDWLDERRLIGYARPDGRRAHALFTWSLD